MTLNIAYVQHIKDFKNSYLQLPVSVTPKAHAVFYHVPEFIALKGTALAFLVSNQQKPCIQSSVLNGLGTKETLITLIMGASYCVSDYNRKHL